MYLTDSQNLTQGRSFRISFNSNRRLYGEIALEAPYKLFTIYLTTHSSN